jgi:hypothetical protein
MSIAPISAVAPGDLGVEGIDAEREPGADFACVVVGRRKDLSWFEQPSRLTPLSPT